MALYERNNNTMISSLPAAGRKKKNRSKRGERGRQNHHHHISQLAIEPSEKDADFTLKLQETLYNLGVYDSEQGLQTRKTVLKNLQHVLNQWALSHSSNTDNLCHRPRVALISFGSYRLGVHHPDADIDVLALSPPTCTRQLFFTTLVEMLDKQESVTELHPIPGAYTPVIKFKMDGIAIDLLFARLSNSNKLLQPISLTQELTIDDEDLVGMDEAEMRALNGSRVAQMILELVPNQEHYRVVLRAVKEWALVHGLYSNVLGFLGGVNWAILVAHVCMQHPEALPSLLLRHFFRQFSQWTWPAPVALVPIADQPPPGVSPLPVWNPQVNPRDGHHIMPIITPAYPSMNSSYNVGVPQLRRIQIEFNHADQIMMDSKSTFRDLYITSSFFTRHAHFLQINITADNAADFMEWFRLCESKLRILITALESPEMGVEVFPFAKFFSRKYSKSGTCMGAGTSDPDCKMESCFFMALRFAYGVEHADLRYCTSEFLQKVNSWEGRCLGMDLTIEHVLQQDLPSYLWLDSLTTKGISTNRRNGGMKHAPPPSITGKEPMTDIDIRPLSPALDRKLKITAPVNNDKSDNNNTTNKEVKPSASLSPAKRPSSPSSVDVRPHSPLDSTKEDDKQTTRLRVPSPTNKLKIVEINDIGTIKTERKSSMPSPAKRPRT